MRFWGSIQKHIKNWYLNRLIGLTVTKTDIFGKVVTVGEYFFSYFNEEIMRITHAKFQAKILNIMGSRTL